MRIAQVAPLMEAVPPKLYGGSERIVAYLCDELTALGHEVTLFASGDSTVVSRLAAVWPSALRLHAPISRYLLLRRAGVPFLTTLHGRLDLPVLQHIYHTFDDVPVVTISDAQRGPVPH